MNIDDIRDVLFQNMEEQRAADIAAAKTNELLGNQKIMYNNEARGTLYSGQPTWERAQLAANTVSNLAKINQGYLDNKINIWNNITSTLDQINSYNKAAAAMTQSANSISSATSTGQSFLDLYNELKGGN